MSAGVILNLLIFLTRCAFNSWNFMDKRILRQEGFEGISPVKNRIGSRIQETNMFSFIIKFALSLNPLVVEFGRILLTDVKSLRWVCIDTNGWIDFSPLYVLRPNFRAFHWVLGKVCDGFVSTLMGESQSPLAPSSTFLQCNGCFETKFEGMFCPDWVKFLMVLYWH